MLYINSPGGSVTAGMAIYDTMQYITLRCVHHLRGHGGVHGRVPAGGRRKGQAQSAAQRRNHDPPALRRRPGAGYGCGHCGGAYHQNKSQTEPHFRQSVPASRWKRLRRMWNAIIIWMPKKPRPTAWWMKSFSPAKRRRKMANDERINRPVCSVLRQAARTGAPPGGLPRRVYLR